MKTSTPNQDPPSLISIVDDEPSIRRSLSRLIRSAGYRTREYDSAEAFLTWGWWDESACLILDVRLPAMSGLELQHYLAEQQPGRPIVFISGKASENERTWAILKGASAFLTKPFSNHALLQAIQKAVDRGQTTMNTTPGRSGIERPCTHCCGSRACLKHPSHRSIIHTSFRNDQTGD